MAIDTKMIDEKLKQIDESKKKLRNLLARYGKDMDEIDRVDVDYKPEFNLNCNGLKELRVACVMDRFTLDSYRYECRLFELTPKGWKKEIDEFVPHLLFIESAWQGKNGLWYKKIANGSKEYFEMTCYCRDKGIPVVFWNKEDPVYTDVFMAAARMADFVFTTDIDCIKKYKETLRHDNVYHLHFAAQPEIHNPIEKFQRKDKYCFAGAYYHRYKERAEVFDKFAEFFINTKGFDIYDRNYKKARPEHAFPSFYNKYILGGLDPGEIDIAYKGYNFGINMNSISQSQTMFARRVFEMMASNTVTVGNYSRGLKNYFGDLTICTNDEDTLEKYVNNYCGDDAALRKYRLLGLRKVLQDHLYEDRLDYVVKKVFGKSMKKKLPEIVSVANAHNPDDAGRIIASYKKQSYINKCLYIIVNNDFQIYSDSEDINIIDEAESRNKLSREFNSDDYIAVISPDDYYGCNYFLDLILTTRYGDFSGIGKGNCCKGANAVLEVDEKTDFRYKYVNELHKERSIFKIGSVSDNSLYEFALPGVIHMDGLFSVDEFNYCAENKQDSCPAVDDIVIYDYGLTLKDIEQVSENIKYDKLSTNGIRIVCDDIVRFSKIPAKSKVSYKKNNEKLLIESNLDEDVHKYIYMEKFFETAECVEDGKMSLMFNGSGNLDLTGVCVFFDKAKNKISPVFTQMNRLVAVDVPSNAVYMKLGFRPKGKGSCEFSDIFIGADVSSNQRGCFLSRSNVLVLTNQYPSPNSLYRNMFVHKRVQSYKNEGYVYDVMRMNIYAGDELSEFEGINIIEGQSEALSDILNSGAIDTVCVHFLDRQMWSVLQNFPKKIRIIVWLHGAEIQPWWRREYNYNSESELENAKSESSIRLKFWKDIFDNIGGYNIHFVFVSNYFAEEIFEDNKITLPENKYSVIHNCIDTDLFSYRAKPSEQRKKILSIRPFASNKYANDLTVKCILELSKKPFFSDLNFKIVGNGELFDSVLKPLKRFKNIELKRGFLRQDEIAELHKEYGIFITPTRMDAQGVSRDEAMSSGLVPVTNAVTAIPEFVDNNCGILAEGEDYISMTEGIEKLSNNPDLFLKMSKNAADRVRNQSSKAYTIDKEIQLINGSR